MRDQGSRSQKARVVVGGVPVEGIVDTGADITIMSGDIFKRVAAVGKLCKCDFKAADKTPRNYDRKPFRVDGRLDLDVTFQNLTCPCLMLTDQIPSNLTCNNSFSCFLFTLANSSTLHSSYHHHSPPS